MLAVTRRDGPRRCPAPGKGSHRPHPSARPRARHRLAELPTSPLVARLSGREQRRVRKVVALRMKAMSYRPSPTAAPSAPVAHRLAAVAVPDALSPFFTIAPPPITPTPVISPPSKPASAADWRPRTP